MNLAAAQGVSQAKSSKAVVNKIAAKLSTLALFMMSACMSQNQSILATRNATEIDDSFGKEEKVLMIYETATETQVCLLSPAAQKRVKVAQEDQPKKFKAANSFGIKAADSFSVRTKEELAKASKKSPEPCSLDWEEWFIKSIALGTPAPMDVASVAIPNLAEIKMGIAGAGVLAGLCGRPIEATAVALCSIALNYAQDKGLVKPAN